MLKKIADHVYCLRNVGGEVDDYGHDSSDGNTEDGNAEIENDVYSDRDWSTCNYHNDGYSDSEGDMPDNDDALNDNGGARDHDSSEEQVPRSSACVISVLTIARR